MGATPLAASAVAPDQPSLYQRLGEHGAIVAVVDDFVGRVGTDARINAFFRGVDLDDLKTKLVDQICEASGGPCRYRGRSMREAHAGLVGLTNQHFDALVGDLAPSLDHLSVGEREKTELLTTLGRMRGEIVGR